MKKLILFFALIGGIVFFAEAQTTPKIARKQVKQTARIEQGVVTGELTKREARKLKQQQRHIQTEKRMAKADGVVSKRERAHIRHDQRTANRNIYRQKNDAQKKF